MGLFGGSTKVYQTSTNVTEVDVGLETTNIVDLTKFGEAIEQFLGLTADQQKIYAMSALLQADAEQKRTQTITALAEDGRYLLGAAVLGIGGWWLYKNWR